ncbi:unnamed protein product [Symbiodinium natans]|uniref:SPRY domain-containing protein 7 n=1 Tax=Symbiodinium natans TaxID=878477 RepID=A0A812L6F8_9DINO|nr:unnamed protein product [Symbiodinium natans]
METPVLDLQICKTIDAGDNDDKSVELTSIGADLAPSGSAGIFIASCPSRARGICTVQGSVPLSPGESFKLRVLNLGTLGEIGIGLCALGEAQKQSITRDMVGWSRGEVGFHGDHGRSFVNGHGDQNQRSRPWSVGHEIECGLTAGANVYFKHSGEQFEQILEMPGRWQISLAYPTVTMRSSGSSVEIDLRGVEDKPLKDLLPHSGPDSSMRKGETSAQLRSASSALTLLTLFKRTVIAEEECQEGPGVTTLERWLAPWCCQSIEVDQAPTTIAA